MQRQKRVSPFVEQECSLWLCCKKSEGPVYQQSAPPPPAAPTGLTDEGIAQLKQLGQLHESGVLTDAELEASKQKILGI